MERRLRYWSVRLFAEVAVLVFGLTLRFFMGMRASAMSEPFDPYHKWLGIPPKDQPPNHYRLLGIDLFESDSDVISYAADMRMSLVHNFQSGKHSDLAKKIRNEISAVRVCLIDPEKKAAYDAKLKTEQSGREAPKATKKPPIRTARSAVPIIQTDSPSKGTPKYVPSQSKSEMDYRSEQQSPAWQSPMVLGVAVGGFVLLLLIILLVNNSGDKPKESDVEITKQESLSQKPAKTSRKTLTGKNPVAAKTKSLPIAHTKDTDAYYYRGNSWETKGEYDKAIADHSEAIRLNPKYARAYYGRGNAWSQKGDHDKAIADYTEAIRLNPKDAYVYNNRGIAWENKGDKSKAEADYKRARELGYKDDTAKPEPDYDRVRDLVSKAMKAKAAETNQTKGDPPPADLLEGDTVVWIDDSVPEGAKTTHHFGHPWRWVSKPHPVYSGDKSMLRQAKGPGQHYFWDARNQVQIQQGDKLFAYVYIDPKNPPQMVMLQFNDGSWEHRVYWGDITGSPWASKVDMGPVPKAGEWIRLEVEAAKVDLRPGSRLNGWGFSQIGGTVYYDMAGVQRKQ